MQLRLLITARTLCLAGSALRDTSLLLIWYLQVVVGGYRGAATTKTALPSFPLAMEKFVYWTIMEKNVKAFTSSYLHSMQSSCLSVK